MRVMMFVDGENLTYRFQAMQKAGRIKTDATKHRQDVYVWHQNLWQNIGEPPVRIYYYTSVVGGEPLPTEVRTEISKLTWIRQGQWGNAVPKVFSKKAKDERSRHVDIAITIDVLKHALSGHVDAIWIVSGDRDFLPLIKEVMNHGVRVFVAALSSGLFEELPRAVDGFMLLDNDFFYQS